MAKTRILKQGEVEIVWGNGTVEVLQTTGVAYASGAIVLNVGTDTLIIPMTAVRRFRVPKL